MIGFGVVFKHKRDMKVQDDSQAGEAVVHTHGK